MERPRSLDELQTWTAGRIKRLLTKEGVSDRGCIEKADYVKLAAQVLKLQGGGADGLDDEPRSGSMDSLKSVFTYLRSASPTRSPSRSRSASSSRSPGGRKRKPKDWASEVMRLTPNDVATLRVGASGKTYEKVARVTGAELILKEKENLVEIRGSLAQRRRSKKYCQLIMRQRLDPSILMMEGIDDDDLTIIAVPPDVVGYVSGQGGGVLRSIEEEWNSLMFFIDTDLTRSQRVAIFGTIRGRRGSELKVLSAIETKMPGYTATVHNEIMNRDRYKDPTGTWGTDWMTFRDEGEISYALGKRGGTRIKLEHSSGSVVQYVGMMVVCSGTKVERMRAREYMKWLFQQLEGPVYVTGWEGREDCTVVDIPSDCIGYITGNRRAALGSMEEEWGSLMFFMSERDERGGRGGTERLAIFGPERGRYGSELKIMSSIETKSPGFFTRGLREKISTRRGFDTDRLLMRDEEVSYALGKDGSTRKKLELASGAILQYVGHVAFIAGDLPERRRCREFVQWLLQQRRGAVTIADIADRDDVTEVNIPANCKGWVAGNRGSELRRMEQMSGTYMFMALDAKGEERLLIFGVVKGRRNGEGGRLHAERLVKELVREKQFDDVQRGGPSAPPPTGLTGQAAGGRRESRSRSRRRRRSSSSSSSSSRKR